MKGYKGFNKGLVCRGKRYAENTVFEEERAVICHSGMHFCENPLDVLDYYPLLDNNGELNEFAEVESLAAVDTDDKKKYTTTKLRIGAKLHLAGFVKASVEFMLHICKKVDKKKDSAQMASSGNSAQMASSGDYAQMASSGYSAQMASSGKNSVVAAIGYNSIAKAAKGSWITLAEWERNEEGVWIPVLVKTRKVDGKHIKSDTWYKLKNGKFEAIHND